MFRKIIVVLIVVLIVIAAILAFNTFTAPDKQRKAAALPAPALPDSALSHFRQSIRFKTVSFGDSTKWDSVPFIQFRKFLENTYPLVHAKLTREIVRGYSLLFTWEGKNKSLNPYIIMAHQDVVPVEENTEKLWTVDPFAGLV